MAAYDYDLFIIGAGSAGVRMARMSAGYGARVAIAEDRYYGGTCVNVGCVPKKLFVYAAHFREDFEAARGYGWDSGSPGFDWSRLLANKNAEIARLNGVYERLLDKAGVTVIDGRAGLLDAHTVAVGDRRFRAERIVVATGGWPRVPDIPGREYVITSNEVFHLSSLPRRILIVGGGYIAVEFAGIFHGLGVETTLSYRGPLFLRGFDDDVREFLASQMRLQGMDLRFDSLVTAIERRPDGQLNARFADGTELQADQILYATGRVPNTSGLGLEALGVEQAWNGAIRVNADYQSSVPSIYALGDVTHRINLTPVALAEGMVLAGKLYAGSDARVDYDTIPTAVFSQPSIGSVGLTEAEARERHGQVDIYRSSFTPMKHSLSGLPEKNLMKLIVDRVSDQVIGIHMVGAEAGEIIQGMAIAMRAGATKATFDSTIGVHPTAAEEFVSMREPLPDPTRG